MNQSKLRTLLNEEEVKSAKEIIEKEYGREYDILREFFFRRGALVFKNNQYKASSLDSLADTILNQLPENNKSIKQFESIISKAAKQYKKELLKLDK